MRLVIATVATLSALSFGAARGEAIRPTASATGQMSPAAYYEKAAANWANGAREDATFWLYVAQLRSRARLTARTDLDPTGEPALYSALMETVGRPINEYAFGDVAEACRQIDRALRWDEDNPDPSIPDAMRRTTQAGLMKLKDYMLSNVDEIRRQRAASGLPNR
jgi:hypothetical protein